MELTDLDINLQSRTIVSVFPIRCELERDYGPTMSGGRTKYVLEAAPKGGYSTLVVKTSFQRTLDMMNSTMGHIKFVGTPVGADELVNDLMKHWFEQRIGTAAGNRPGIKALPAGQSEPTAQDIEGLVAQQRAYADALIHEATGFAARHQWANITAMHRALAIWRGYKTPVGQADWIAELGSGGQWKECVACFEKINARATKCKVCLTDQPSVVADEKSIPSAEAKRIKPPLQSPVAA